MCGLCSGRIKLNGTLHTILFTVYIKSAKAFIRFLKRIIIYNYNLLLNFIFIIDVYLPILLQCKLLCGKF